MNTTIKTITCVALALVLAACGGGLLDFDPPKVRILAPSSSGSHISTTARVSITGVAEDKGRITRVTWTSSRATGGTAFGNSSWGVNDVSLLPGDNVITVTAEDEAKNRGHSSITIKYQPPATQAIRAGGPARVSLAWEHKPGMVYSVYRSIGGDGAFQLMQGAVASASWQDDQVVGDIVYVYRVIGRFANGDEQFLPTS